jgi:hypothetical protein
MTVGTRLPINLPRCRALVRFPMGASRAGRGEAARAGFAALLILCIANTGSARATVSRASIVGHQGPGLGVVNGDPTPKQPVLAVNGSGWTIFAPSSDTVRVYVSASSGSDLGDGLSPATAKRTLAAAVSLLRHGYPDWLLLKRGDVWQESLGHWKKSGRTAAEPMLVSTYGNAAARPQLQTGEDGGIWTNGGSGSPATIDNLSIVGLHFFADGYGGGGDCIGARMLLPSKHLLIEDCEFECYSTNLVFQGVGGRHSDFRLRRSVIVDAYSVHAIGGHSQGLYAYAVDGLVIEDNLFDHNGWNESVPGAGADIYSHNLYIDNDNTGVVVRGNIIANASSHGVQLRPGGSVVDNLFVRNSISLSVGGGNNPDPGGVMADVRKNVILDGKDIDGTNPRGWGIWLANIVSGKVANNVIANNTLGTQPNAITLDGEYVGDSGPSVGVHDLVIATNILYDWGGGMLVKGNSVQITDVSLIDNDVQDTIWPTSLLEYGKASSIAAFQSAGNRFHCELVPVPAWTEIASVPQAISYWFLLVGDTTSTVRKVVYPDPVRSVPSYNTSLGGAPSLDAFLAEARLQSHAYWREEYRAQQVNAYIRAGFWN